MTKTHDSDEIQDDGLPDKLHQVVVFGVPDDPHQLRDVIADQLGINHIDAQIQVHSLPGVLPAAQPMHGAARLAEAIRELGVNAAAIPSAEVPKLELVEPVHHLRCRDDGLQILDLRGEIQTTIAWKNVALLSVGIVPHRAQHLAGWVPTLAVSLATSHRDEQPTSGQQGSLELLVLVANPLRAFRIDHGHLNYEYLGDRMSASGTVNFRWLIQDLVNRASSATITPATRSFLEHGLARHYEFGSSEEMTRYTVFHLIIRDAALGPRDDDTDDSGDSAATSKQDARSKSIQHPKEVRHAVKTDH